MLQQRLPFPLTSISGQPTLSPVTRLVKLLAHGYRVVGGVSRMPAAHMFIYQVLKNKKQTYCRRVAVHA